MVYKKKQPESRSTEFKDKLQRVDYVYFKLWTHSMALSLWFFLQYFCFVVSLLLWRYIVERNAERNIKGEKSPLKRIQVDALVVAVRR